MGTLKPAFGSTSTVLAAMPFAPLTQNMWLLMLPPRADVKCRSNST